jgi:hypothetical protein
VSKLELEAKNDRAQGAFGPRSFRIARFLITSRAPTLIDLLDEVAEAWPGLSFEDFRSGYILSDILLRYPDQIRTVAEGMPTPGGDPLAWLDRVIALTTPTRGNA